MCFSSDNTASDIAQQNRADEVARQARITAGMSKINSVFDGGPMGVNAATSYDPSKTYYNADGSTYSPSAAGAGGYGDGIGGIARRMVDGMGGGASPQDLISQGKLFTGTQTTGGFNDAFYNGQKQAYVDYAQPQADHQAGLAHDQEVYALARSGLLDSLAGQKENSELTRQEDQNRIDIQNQGQNVANQARSNVEQARGNLVSELNATGDDAAAAAGAVRQAQNLYQPVGFSPLGQLFSSFTQGLSSIGSNANNNYGGLFNQLPALFNRGGSGSSSVVTG